MCARRQGPELDYICNQDVCTGMTIEKRDHVYWYDALQGDVKPRVLPNRVISHAIKHIAQSPACTVYVCSLSDVAPESHSRRMGSERGWIVEILTMLHGSS